MRNKFLLSIVAVFVSIQFLNAQVPDKINYQAVVRNTTGEIVANQLVGVRISILEGTIAGPVVFQETHSPTTNNYGLINFQIGTGSNSGPALNTVDWSADDYFIQIEVDPTGGTSYTINSVTQLVAVPYAMHARTVEFNDDADADPTNEYNTGATFDGTNLQITDAGSTLNVDLSSLEDDADADPTNEIQTISKVGNIITLSDGGGAITDDVNDADASPTNELQTVSVAGSTVTLSNGGGSFSINDADASTTNELNTSANLSGTTLNIIDAGGTISVNLSSLVNDADASTTNELNTGANLSGTTLNIIDAGGTISVNLSSLVNDADASTTNELNTGANLSGSTLNIIDAGGTISVNLASLDTDDQTLSVSGNDLTISGGNTVALPTQTLSLVGTTLSISDGNSVTLGSGTDSQTLSISGNDLTILNGNTVTLPTGADDQTLSLSGADLTISDGNTITLPVQTHFVGEHFGGGIIVWVDSTGQHGLICAYADVPGGPFVFENLPNNSVSIASSTFDGQSNTATLIATSPGDYVAAEQADAYAGGGFTDWYLPSVYELELILSANYVLGPYALQRFIYYWSSTESNVTGINAERVRNNSLYVESISESSTAHVRCVRKF